MHKNHNITSGVLPFPPRGAQPRPTRGAVALAEAVPRERHGSELGICT